MSIETTARYLALLVALDKVIEDACACDDPACRDGTGPVCDISNMGCYLRRIVTNPAEVDQLIAAEHAWSGIED